MAATQPRDIMYTDSAVHPPMTGSLLSEFTEQIVGMLNMRGRIDVQSLGSRSGKTPWSVAVHAAASCIPRAPPPPQRAHCPQRPGSAAAALQAASCSRGL